MAAAKKSGTKSTAKKRSVTSAATSAARKTATRATKAAAAKGLAAGGERIGRGTRWTEQQVALLMDTVSSSATAKEAFEQVAKQLGKSTGTVQQKYYNLQRSAGGGRSGTRGPRAARGMRSGGAPTAAQLRTLTIDELVGLAALVKGEVDRRREELDDAARQLAGLAG